jgi:hypothetical protein
MLVGLLTGVYPRSSVANYFVEIFAAFSAQ